MLGPVSEGHDTLLQILQATRQSEGKHTETDVYLVIIYIFVFVLLVLLAGTLHLQDLRRTGEKHGVRRRFYRGSPHLHRPAVTTSDHRGRTHQGDDVTDQGVEEHSHYLQELNNKLLVQFLSSLYGEHPHLKNITDPS